LLVGARVVVGLLVLAAVVVAVWKNWDAVSADLARISVGAFVLSCALALLSLVCTLIGWRALMADLGSPLPLGPASGVLFVGQLGKYLPGSVWTVVVQAEVASALGVPRRRTAVAGLLSVVLSALAGLGIGILALPALVSGGGGASYLLVLLVVPVAAVVLHPKVLNRLVGRGLRLIRRPPLEHPLSGRAIAVTMAAFLAAWTLLGLHVYTLVLDLGGPPRESFVPAVFGYALAAAVGMIVVLLPAGFGLREVVLAVLLTGPLNKSEAAAVVLLSRFIITGSDVVAAAVGWLYDRSHHLMAARRAGVDAAAGVTSDAEAGAVQDQPPAQP
jgi:hypothetical protein